MLSYIDHELEVRQMAQRANRANVSFYPLDPRGLTAFDDSLGGAFRPSSLAQDRERLASRQDGLKVLAEQTDGVWILNTNDTAGAPSRASWRIRTPTILLSYYSTNPKLDGRFRRITVRVKRPDTEVRARPGYMAADRSRGADRRCHAGGRERQRHASGPARSDTGARFDRAGARHGSVARAGDGIGHAHPGDRRARPGDGEAA